MRKKILPLEFRVYPTDKNLNQQWFVQGCTEAGKRVKYRVPNAPTVRQREALAKGIIEKFLTEGVTAFQKKEKPIQAAHYILAAFSDLLEEKRAFIRKKTYQSYLAHLRNFNDYIAEKKVKTVTDDTARLFLIWLKSKGLTHTTINAHRVTLTHFYSELSKRRKGLKNPFKSTLKLKENRVGACYLNLKLIDKYKKYVLEHKPFLWLPSIMQFYCFIRPSAELRFVQVADVDLRKNLIRINAKTAKNGKTEYVKIPDPLIPYLDALDLEAYPENYYLIGHDGTPSVKPVSYNYWSEHFRQVRTALNWPDRYVFYSFKHAGAANYMDNTGDLAGLSRQMRHHSTDMTSVYLRSIGLEDFGKLRDGFTDL